MLQPMVQMMPSQSKRTQRHPAHTFNLKVPPYCIQPFMIAPVLAGESLVSATFQARAVSDPVKNRLIGAHLEYYWFYVKLNDLPERATLTEMLLNPAQAVTAIDDPTNRPVDYHPAGTGSMPYTRMAVDHIIDWYFRDEGDDHTNYTVTNGTYTWPVAKINNQTPFDSATQHDDEVGATMDASLTVGVDDTIRAGEIDELMRQYQMLQANGLMQLSYEDYLRMFGVNPQEEVPHKPELIRYMRNWTYPANTVEPTTGVPTSALSWSVQERISKRRFFREPGFIVGITVTRPKVYLRNQQGSFSSQMNRVAAWLPPTTSGTHRGRRLFQGDNVGPFQAGSDTDGWWWDVADLLTYGEQFVNYALATTTQNMVDLPSATLANIQYISSFAQLQELFAGTTPPSLIEHDGICQMHIASHITDISPRGGPEISGLD